ncbi:MAG: PAS domain S-box protein [Vicinamibacterales bacterium]
MAAHSTLYFRVGVLVALGTAGGLLSLEPAFRPLAAIAAVLATVLLGRLAITLGRDAATQAADSLAATERLRSVIDSAVDGIIVIDPSGRVESVNPAAERLFGYSAAEVVGRNVSMLMPSPFHEEHDGYLQRYLSTGEARIIGIGREVTGLRRDGTTFPLHLSVGELTVDGARRFTGILHDLSNRVALEHRLRTSEARWRSIIHSAVDGIVVIDATGRIEAFNPGAERLFGYAEAELVGRNVNVLMPSPYHEEHDTYVARYLETGAARIIGTGREVTGLRKDGSTFPVHLSVGELTVEGERKFTGILHDLTERVRLEGQLRERAALARVGEMAAVIAHEVKNPLAGIRGVIQVIGGRLPSDSRDATVLGDIVKRIDALDMLMKDLLFFARPPQLRRAPVDVGPLVSMTAHLLGQDPSLEGLHVRIAGSAPPLLADAEMLKIVFQNLLVNAAHAMHGEGTIDVRISATDDGCEVAFTDVGPGIPLDIRDKIFTAFFTTKVRGTGLGLATARRLVEAHHGEIRVDCPPGGGTTVTVKLPIETRVTAAV